ncbi:YfhO family protein [Terrimonas pollutisoli]|uniref:YfhO family protein n=1 Tax=Terrimonas pollutisoli TaxID=3034147 RepID=UPI0023ED5541|nr:YfhO family protein [Terrimonas sp. H1YJ31]
MQQLRNFLLYRNHYLFLLLISMIAYWPLTFNVFSLKNDALVYFLPYRYHISEAIQNGQFPWWNPYLYTGLPLHSDIQSGVWNPVMMFISFFTTYNLTVLQWELLFYLFVAATSMFKLTREFGYKKNTSIITATAYCCCGFMTDSGSIIPWITSAAYLPFVFLYFFRLLNSPCLQNSFKLSLALSLLLTAGYPSYFIFCTYILLAALIVWLTRHFRNQRLKPVLFYLFAALITFIILCSPVILSWWDFMRYYERGGGATLVRAQTNSFPIFSSISYLLPSAVSKNHEWLLTDRSARNASVGIFVFVFFILALTEKIQGLQKFLLSISIFSFLFSLGDATPLRGWCHRLLPLMNTFRHPASMRIFSSIAIILLAAKPLNSYFNGANFSLKRLKNIILSILGILLTLLIIYIPTLNLREIQFTKMGKNLLDRLGFADMMALQGSLQIVFILFFLFFSLKKNKKVVLGLFATNLIIFCWMALPFTFISQVKTSTVNRYLSSFPKGYPLPDLTKPIGTYKDTLTNSALGQEKFYNKTITIQDHVITPTLNSNYLNFLSSPLLRSALNGYPFAYFPDRLISSLEKLPATGRSVLVEKIGRMFFKNDSTASSVQVLKFNNNCIDFETITNSKRLFVLFQQYHHGWHAFEDDIPIPVYRANKAFLAVAVSEGRHKISFQFRPALAIKPAMYTSLVMLFAITAFLLFHLIKDVRFK